MQLKVFIKEYTDYCKKIGLKKETMLLHPHNLFNNYPQLFDKFTFNRNTCNVNLQKDIGYNQTTRNLLRKPGITVQKTNNVVEFIHLYHQALMRMNADKKYYFPYSYYKRLYNMHDVELYEASDKDNVLSIGFFFLKPPVASYHLSAIWNGMVSFANFFLNL